MNEQQNTQFAVANEGKETTYSHSTASLDNVSAGGQNNDAAAGQRANDRNLSAKTLTIKQGNTAVNIEDCLRERLQLSDKKSRKKADRMQRQKMKQQNKEAKAAGKRSWFGNFLSLLGMFAICFAIAMLINRFVLQRNTVVGTSMLPTLQNHDQLLVEKISHLWRDYERGEIITSTETEEGEKAGAGVVESRETVIIKRIIGLPGEKIQIYDGSVIVNGRRLQEDYLPKNTLTEAHDPKYMSVQLGKDEYFLMGDNRKVSRDSRDFGPVKRDAIIGRLLLRIYPFASFGRP